MDAPYSWLQWVAFATLAIGALVYIIATHRRTQNEELRQLADARAERIKDLQQQLANAEAELSAWKNLKVEDMATRLAAILVERIEGLFR